MRHTARGTRLFPVLAAAVAPAGEARTKDAASGTHLGPAVPVGEGVARVELVFGGPERRSSAGVPITERAVASLPAGGATDPRAVRVVRWPATVSSDGETAMIGTRSGRFASLVLALAPALALACSDGPVGNAAREDGAAADAAGGIRAYHGVTAAGGGHIAILDDCDPTDPAWAPTGGCALARGHVTLAEFIAFLGSPLSGSVVGHPAWRNEPSYVRVQVRQPVHVMNRGGRAHTLTPVAAFGGGRVPPLSGGLTMAPECALAPGATDPYLLLPGQSLLLTDLPAGVHRLQCCIHPWMRQVIRVEAGAS